MKKTKVLSLFLAVLMVFLTMATSMTALASSYNTPATANPASVGNTQVTFKYGYPTGSYDSYESLNEIYYKFTPSKTGYYEFQVTGYENTKYAPGYTANVDLYVTDINGKTVASAYTNEFNMLTKTAAMLTKGQTYYINIYNSMSSIASYYDNEWGYAEQTLTLKISEHKHTYVTTNYSSFNYVECSYCDYEFYDYNVGTVKSIALSRTSFVYNGKVQTPVVTCTDTNGKVISKSAYSVSISGNKKSVGTYTVTVKFGSGYKNAVKKLTYKIVPKGTTISSVSARKKAFTVKWKKQATQTTGYQIQYATNSKFTKAKTLTVAKNTTTSKTVSKLSAKKKYYVRVRTYKSVNGTKYYSSWSKSKSITTK